MLQTTKTKHSFAAMLQELVDVAGPSGNETAVGDVMKKWVQPWADEISTDRLGSFIARKGLSGPRIMLAAHLDEIGFMITKITEDGYLQFQTLGGWWSQVLPAQRVEVLTQKGKILGVVGSKPPHLMTLEERKKGVELDDLFIDLGVESREEAETLGVRPGDFIIPYSPYTKLNHPHRIVGKAMDNRTGCAIVAEVLHRLSHGVRHPNQVFAVGTVMEEVGRRGAKTATAVVKPDIAFAVDVGIATDTPKIGNTPTSCGLGKGPVLVLYDAGHIAHQPLLQLVRDVAEELEIPYQYEVVQRGGTDASNIHTYHHGVPTISLGVPSRYIHSHTSMIDQRDVEHLITWLVTLTTRLDRRTIDKLIR
jgi:putative aminopeptidase FrvX